MKKGFTLIEVLIYIAVLVIIITAVSAFFLWGIRSNTKAKVMRETLDNSSRAMKTITREIKEAISIYTETSTFDSHPGQLSLETTKYLPAGERTTYVDFYLCGTQLCFKKESQDPIALTSNKVRVSNLVFSRIITNEIPSIQINLNIDYKDLTGRPEYQASVNLISTTSLRKY
jgi:prepilin-type N-terminal cleavage/methylation domain-containing protein